MSTSAGLPVEARPGDLRTGRAVPRLFARWVAIFTLLGAAVIHASVIREHLEEWPAAGVLFIVLTVLEAGLAIVLARRWSTSTGFIVIAVSLGTILLWAVSRTAGMPIGPEPWVPEPIGRPDLVATALEGATVFAALALNRGDRAPTRPPVRVRYLLIVSIGALIGTPTWFAISAL